MPVKIGVPGNYGTISELLLQSIKLFPDTLELVFLDLADINNSKKIESLIATCDSLFLPDGFFIRPQTEEQAEILRLTNLFIETLTNSLRLPTLFLLESSKAKNENMSIHSMLLNLYSNNLTVTSILNRFVLPEVFGPLNLTPQPNSVNELCYHASINKLSSPLKDENIELIYAGDAVDQILKTVGNWNYVESASGNQTISMMGVLQINKSEIANHLSNFQTQYLGSGNIPSLENQFEKNLFLTFSHYADHAKLFPRKLVPHSDSRGIYAEVLKTNGGGQISFSTTVPGITRGNHFHTRKIERFTVIKGKANIQLRRIDSEKIITFELNGENPSYVDMPVWFTHSLTNTGKDELIVIFWINEPYDPNNADTFQNIVSHS